MAGEDEIAVERDIELARPTGNEFELGETLGFEARLRTEGTVFVASRLAVMDAYFHAPILSDRRGLGRASRRIALKTIICGLVSPR